MPQLRAISKVIHLSIEEIAAIFTQDKMDTMHFDFNLERDTIEKDGQYKNRQIFSLPVRMENWNEDLFLKEEKNKLTNMKRIRCELLVEKTRTKTSSSKRRRINLQT
ncbi:hypothetical protein QE152_g26888 [Popillia japonica]|uniref:Uncharacterized protein n=1 Tax=Popillia japonica TaxID=7064 RepID=A0AAW1JWV7_POPJA